MHTWNDLLGVFPGLIGVKTGHTDDAGWCEVAAARRAGYTIYAVILGSPTRAQRNFDLQRLLAWGVSQYRTLTLVARAAVRVGGGAVRPPRRRARGAAAARARGSRRPAARRADRRADRRFPARDAGRAARPGRDLVRADAARDPAAPRRQDGRAARARRTATVVRHADRAPSPRVLLVIVTVTLNAAVDRTLTVPNFQLGHRHRASASLTSAGGKGINVARALKRLDSPVIATGLAGGTTGDRIIDELAGEAILNDFVRIGDESRTSIGRRRSRPRDR